MKKIFFGLLALSFFSSQNLFGQKMPSDYFDEGEKYVEANDNKNALASFQYIVKHYPKNTLYPKAFYNVGYLYFMNKQYDSSIVVFKSILTSNFNEKENLGGGIMDDPYTNYRHRASKILSDIYYNKKMYDTALYYFSLSDTLYPYLHFCGNEYAANDIHTALTYSDLYQKIDNKDKAIESLLHAVFVTLANNTKVISELKTLLKKKKNLKSELDNALDNMYSKTIQRETYSYTQHYFKFMNAEILVPNGYEDEKKKFDKDEAIKEIKKTDFYKMIRNL
jgi:tetratricopeptide (TPR) repeat protein